MLRSIVISALRNMNRNRIFSLINISGMIISMSLGLLIILVVVDQYSYDTFHQDTERIYRVNSEAFRTNGGSEKYATTPALLPEKLLSDYSFFEEVAALSRGLNSEVISSGERLDLRGFFATPSFFKIFNFEFESSIQNPLLAPFQIVLTQASAKKFFGNQNPIGKILRIEGIGEFTVSGILKENPGNTHLEFEALASQSTLPALSQSGLLSLSRFEWKNYYSSYCYFKVKPGVRISDIENALTEIENENYKEVMLDARDKKIAFYLQPLSEITPGPELSENLGRGLPGVLLYFLMGLAAIVMIMACLNYTQLTIAKSISRGKEIGIRKVIGAGKWQVFMQFIGEAVVISLVSLMFSYLLLQFIKPVFLTLHISQEFSFNLNESPEVLFLFLGFAVLIGALAGLLPAIFLSGFKPVQVLKSGDKIEIGSKLSLRKIMLTGQFTFAVIFILTVLIINKQTQFMINADYGINTEGVINLRLNGTEYDKIAPEIAAFSWAKNVSGVSHSLGTFADGDSDYKKTMDSEPFQMRDFSVTHNYLQNLDIQLVAGRYFEEEMVTSGGEKFIILNEQAVQFFGFENHAGAIGESVFVEDTVMLQVVGVVKDFHFRPFNYNIGPVAFRLQPDRVSLLNIRIDGQTNQEQTISAVNSVWVKFQPDKKMDWKFMNDEIKNVYEESGLTDIRKIVGYISFLAISISCLGLLGMVMFIVQARSKEIGVRKILGASVSHLVLLLSKSSIIIFGIALIIGLPVSYLLGDLFLSLYAYKITIGAGLILTGIGIILMLVFLTISSQTLPTAKANPLKWIRHE